LSVNNSVALRQTLNTKIADRYRSNIEIPCINLALIKWLQTVLLELRLKLG
jgi:hypothetical protein